MESSLTPVLLVDHKFQTLTERFVVETTPHDYIYHLKKNVKDRCHKYFSGHNIDILELIVWKPKGDMVINKFTLKRLAEILGNIDIHDEDTIEKLLEDEKVADLGLSNGQTLLVQVPPPVTEAGPVGPLITSTVDQEYAHCFLQASTNGHFTAGDITSNRISVLAHEAPAPKFVRDYEETLSRKRMVAPNMRGAAEMLFDKSHFDEYFSSTVESSESSPHVDSPEIKHLIHISSVDAVEWDPLKPKKPRKEFKEIDAYWLFFYAFSKHCNSLPLTNGQEKFTVKRSSESWPFLLVIKVGEEYFSYRPKSDFLILAFDLPRLAVEVNSGSQGRDPVDFYRVLIQGASVVRFANTSLDAFKKEKDFIFVAIFIKSNGAVDRYLLYQDQDENSQVVYSKKKPFDLTNTSKRMEFALEFYNFCSALHAESRSGDTLAQVKNLKESLDIFKDKHHLHGFTKTTSGKSTKRSATDNGGEERPPNRARTGGVADEQLEQLEGSGYEVVPDVLETKGGTWELIEKPPPHIRIVYRRNDPNKTQLIAKHVRKGSNEPAIYEYLHTRLPQSPHVISLIEAIPSTTGSTIREWLVLPKLCSIYNQGLMSRAGVDGRMRLGWGLIKGLAYLHEHKIAHRDIKPDNLVCDEAFWLRIIDFDTAIKVQDENTEIDGYRGTKDWTAPEMGEEDGPRVMYSPIKADRWSCGRVLLRYILVGLVGGGDHRLSTFANQLVAKDPAQRPSQLEWRKLLAPPVSERTIVGVSGGSMKPPAAKKPRLERSDQPLPYSLEVSRPMGTVF